MKNWYINALPTIKDLHLQVEEAAKQIAKIEGVKSVYAFGSFAKNFQQKDTRVKDVDIIAKTNIFSEDLISIDTNLLKQCKYKINEDKLAEEGFDPVSVRFSIDYTSIQQPCIDHWVLSSDNKLLHWGGIVENREEHEELKKDAENYADKQNGFNLSHCKKTSESQRKNWIESYSDYVHRFISGVPSGWYLSTEKDIKTIIKDAIKLI